ncbi:unnamed protein product [Gongylonema pulchrum]|uniref:Secreted protein n=1 Tax=Gongylonema pulchrum TaxID=637853 RepID=A0A183D7L5_9BILA|nr:unnamed protein product [Gongylonema pulchrum]
MALTILYITVGLALTTIAIEIAADTLKKVHYFGRKIKDVGGIEIWFGGKRLTVRQVIQNLGDQLNVPEVALNELDMDHFVEQAIKVEAGERPPLRVHYACELAGDADFHHETSKCLFTTYY